MKIVKVEVCTYPIGKLWRDMNSIVMYDYQHAQLRLSDVSQVRMMLIGGMR